MKFWLGETNRTFLDGDLKSARDALGSYYGFASKADIMWSHLFDFVMIQDALEKLKLPKLMWKKWRDINTLVWLSGLKKSKTDNVRSGAHDGLNDAVYQVGYCAEAYGQIRGKQITTEEDRVADEKGSQPSTAS